MDLTPNMKREFSGCILSFSDLKMGEKGLERVHKKILLPLMHVKVLRRKVAFEIHQSKMFL